MILFIIFIDNYINKSLIDFILIGLRRVFMFLVLILLLAGFACGNVLTPLDHNDLGYELLFENEQLLCRETDNFTIIEIPGESWFTSDTARPRLPVVRKFLKIPYNSEINIELINPVIKRLNLTQMGFPARIYPLQPAIPKYMKDYPFRIDENWYRDSIYSITLQEAVNVVPIGTVRGRKLGILEIYPIITYNPRSGDIEYIVSAKVKINFTEPIEPVPQRLRSLIFDEIINDILFIPEEISPDPVMPIVYWVIYGDHFVTDIEPFLDWKKLIGYDVYSTPISAIGPTNIDVADTIQAAYDHWENPPDFVLLVGDVPVIPTNEGKMDDHVTDLYYYTVDDTDFLPDIQFGRFSVVTLAHARNIVEKTLYYEKYELASFDWLKHPVMAACGTDPRCHEAENTHRYCVRTWLTPPRFDSDTLFGRNGADGDDVIDAINAGALLVNYSGHGFQLGWAEPSVGITDVRNLTNNGMYPLVISNSCLTGKFDEAECFGETWIRVHNKGAVGFIGASNFSYWVFDSIWQIKWYDAVFTDSFKTVYGAIFKADMELLLSGDSIAQYYFEVYHLFGDPSLWLYWGTPLETLSVDLSMWENAIPLPAEDYEIPVSQDGAIVALTRNDGRLGVGKSEGGVVSIHPEFEPVGPDSIWVVATKPNYYAPLLWRTENRFLSMIEYSPESLQVGTVTNLSLNLRDGDSIPVPDAVIKLIGFGVSESTRTDIDGDAILTVNPPFEGTLLLTAWVSGIWILRREIKSYGALSWTLDSLSVEVPDILMEDSLTTRFTGNIDFTLSKSGFTCYWQGGGLEIDSMAFTGNSGTVSLEPLNNNSVILSIAKPNYKIITVDIPVTNPEGPLEGEIRDTLGDLVRTRPYVNLIKGTDTITTVRANWDGSFSSYSRFPCDSYKVDLSGFGFYDTSYIIMLTSKGGYSFTMRRMPNSRIQIHPMNSVGKQLETELYLIEQSSNDIIAYGERVDPFTYTFGKLPSVDYIMHAKCRGYMPEVLHLTPVDSVTDINLIMNEGEDILIIDISSDGVAADAIKRDLEDAGYNVDLTVPSPTSFPRIDELRLYNLVLITCGKYSFPFPVDAVRLNILREFHCTGGRVLFEGGEYMQQAFSGTFDLRYSNELFHMKKYIGDKFLTGDMGVINEALNESLLTFYPNPLSDILEYKIVSAIEWAFMDIVKPTSVSELLYSHEDSLNHGNIVIFEDKAHNGVSRSGYFTFFYPYAIRDTLIAKDLLYNMVEFLLPPDQKMAIMYGHVWLNDDLPASHANITTSGYSATSNRQGKYSLSVEAGSHSVTFSRSPCPDTTVLVDLKLSEPKRYDVNWHGSDVKQSKPIYSRLGSPNPNPFNNTVEIAYNNPKLNVVSAVARDISGKIIWEIEYFPKLLGKIRWCPNKNVVSGVYFITVTMGEEKYTCRAVYIK